MNKQTNPSNYNKGKKRKKKGKSNPQVMGGGY